MPIKRNPAITPEHRAKYARISKADLVEAFRDFAREYGGYGETDESLWFEELERRVEIVREQRKQGNSMLHVEQPNEVPTLFGSDVPPIPAKCSSMMGLRNVECPTCGECRSERLIDTGDKPRRPTGEVISRTSWLVRLCGKCETASIDHRQLIYIGDGDYSQIKDTQGRSEITLSFAEWDQGAYHVDGRLITALFDIQPKGGN